MQGIKEIGSYSNASAVGYTEWIRTRAGVYFVREDTGAIVGPFECGEDNEITPPING